MNASHCRVCDTDHTITSIHSAIGWTSAVWGIEPRTAIETSVVISVTSRKTNCARNLHQIAVSFQESGIIFVRHLYCQILVFEPGWRPLEKEHNSRTFTNVWHSAWRDFMRRSWSQNSQLIFKVWFESSWPLLAPMMGTNFTFVGEQKLISKKSENTCLHFWGFSFVLSLLQLQKTNR